MTTLVTISGQLIPGGGPYMTTPSGKRSLSQPSTPLAMWINGGTVELLGKNRTVSYSGIYRTQPWIAAAVNKRYRPIVRLPLKVYKRNSQGQPERVREGRLVDLIERPWKRGSQASLKMYLHAPLGVQGNSVIGFERREGSGGPVTGLKPLDWRFLEPLFLNNKIEAWRTTEFGEVEYFAPEDVLHRRWWAPDGEVGVSPLQQLGVMIRLEDAAQRYQQSSFANGARPPSAIEMPEMSKEEFERLEPMMEGLRDDVDRLYSGMDNAGRPPLLPPGFKWNPLSYGAKEVELIEQRKVNREEAAAVLDVPPPLIGILDNATYSNIDTQTGSLYTDVLGPDIVLAEHDLNTQLASEPAFDGEFVQYDLGKVLRGDRLKEMQAMRQGIGTGLLTPNEARAAQDLPPYGNPADEANAANKLYMPANNMRAIDAPPDPPSDPPDPAAE